MYQNNLEVSTTSMNPSTPFFSHPPTPISTVMYRNRFPPYQQQLFAPTPLANLSQYINPTSEQARQVIIAHEKEFKQRSDDCYKTVMCQNWLEKATCSFGRNCRFAHGEHELRPARFPLVINPNYKTRRCQRYTSKGICPYGDRCLFIHPDQSHVYKSNNMFQHSNPKVKYMAESPPELNDFSNSLPIPQKSRNLLPQLEEQLRMERRENKRKQLHELLKKQDRILANVEVDGYGSSTSILPNTITPTNTPNSAFLSGGYQKKQKFNDSFETLISTLSNVLDTSDLP